MRSRVGLSLIECLVALIVLALGVTGAWLTMAMAVRLQHTARHRQGVVRAAQAELLRFTAIPCPHHDSAWTRVTDDGFHGRWAIVAEDSTVSIRGTVFDPASPARPVLPVEVQRRCE